MPKTPDFRPGDNCWRTSEATRGGFLISTCDFFRAFREACLQARHEVLVLAWDLWDSIELVRGEDAEGHDDFPTKMGDFILAILEDNPDLQVKLLVWDYAMLYLGRRELVPLSQWRHPGHPRLEMVTDDAIPGGASHHQKVVVIDGVLAFTGGMDLAAWRWDRSEHRTDDPLRRNPRSQSYGPHHDVQVALTGPVVGELRDLVAQRWERATGKTLDKLDPGDLPVPWPESVPVDFEDEPLALALTFARYRDNPAVYHIERMHLEMIATARDFLYFENQYLSSHRVVSALEERLREEDGPEVVMVLNRKAGWLENSTLGLVANRLLERLRAADRHGRFHGYYPFAGDDEEGTEIYVHAKLMLADDRLFLGGSANLSNRSMRVDSELNLCFAYEKPVNFIRQLREALLSMHLDVSPKQFREAAQSEDSLAATIDALNEEKRHGKSLRPLEEKSLSPFQRRLADSRILDPEEPLSPMHHAWDALRGQYEVFQMDRAGSLFSKMVWLVSVVFGLGVLALLLVKSGHPSLLHPQLASFLDTLDRHDQAIFVVLMILVVGGVAGLPVNLILVGTTFVLGPWSGFTFGLAGALLASALSFGIGSFFRKDFILRIAGERMESLSASFADCGILSMATVRLLPIAPFGIINLACGLSGMSFRAFMLGSLAGLIPGVAAITLTAHQLVLALQTGRWGHWLLFLALTSLLGGVFVWVRRKLADQK